MAALGHDAMSSGLFRDGLFAGQSMTGERSVARLWGHCLGLVAELDSLRQR